LGRKDKDEEAVCGGEKWGSVGRKDGGHVKEKRREREGRYNGIKEGARFGVGEKSKGVGPQKAGGGR